MLVDRASKRSGRRCNPKCGLERWPSFSEIDGPEIFAIRLENDRNLTCFASLDAREVHVRQEVVSENIQDEVVWIRKLPNLRVYIYGGEPVRLMI